MAFNLKLGKISVIIGADTDDFEEGMDDVEKGLKKSGKSLSDNANKWAKWGLAAGVASAAVLAAFTKSNLNTIRGLKNQAQAANASVKEFQRGAFAVEQFGIETEKYGDILKDVNDRIGDFIQSGAGPMVDFFEQIGPKVGVAIDDFKGLSGPQALGLFVSSLEKANLSQAEMVFFMEAMAGDSALLLPLLRDNGKLMGEMAKQAEDLGIGLSDLDVATVELANRELSKSKGLVTALGQEFTIAVAPIITSVSEELTDAAKEAGGFGEVVGTSMDFAVNAVGFFADGVRLIEVAFKGAELGARAAVLGMAESFDLLTLGNLPQVGKSITEFILSPLIAATLLAAQWSTTAREALIKLDEVLGDTFVGAKKGVNEFTESQKEALSVTSDEFQALLLEKLPSAKIEEFVDDAQEKFRTALSAREVIDLTGGGKDLEGGEFGGGKVADLETDPFIQNLLELNKLESEIEEIRFADKLAKLATFKESELEMLGGFDAAKEQMEEEHARNMSDIKRKEETAKMSMVADGISGAISLLGMGGKKAQKIQQGLSIVSAVIAGYDAAVLAWKAGMATGGPHAPIVAAAYTAASLAKTAGLIAGIKGASKGGSTRNTGGGGGTGAGAGGGGGGGGTAAPLQAERNILIRLEGAEEGLFSANQVRGLMEQINEAIGDGVKLETGEAT